MYRLTRLPIRQLFTVHVQSRVIIPLQYHKVRFASSSDWQPRPTPSQSLIHQLEQHPHIMDQLTELIDLLSLKGVDIEDDKPNITQIMKVMHDPQVKEKAQQLAYAMYNAGIQLDLETIHQLQADLNAMIQGDDPTTAITTSHGRKRGILHRLRKFK